MCADIMERYLKKDPYVGYVLGSILGWKKERGIKRFHIRWKNLRNGETDDIWEYEENLVFRGPIESYLIEHPKSTVEPTSPANVSAFI